MVIYGYRDFRLNGRKYKMYVRSYKNFGTNVVVNLLRHTSRVVLSSLLSEDIGHNTTQAFTREFLNTAGWSSGSSPAP